MKKSEPGRGCTNRQSEARGRSTSDLVLRILKPDLLNYGLICLQLLTHCGILRHMEINDDSPESAAPSALAVWQLAWPQRSCVYGRGWGSNTSALPALSRAAIRELKQPALVSFSRFDLKHPGQRQLHLSEPTLCCLPSSILTCLKPRVKNPPVQNRNRQWQIKPSCTFCLSHQSVIWWYLIWLRARIMIYYGSVNIKRLRLLQVHSILLWGMPFSSLLFPAVASSARLVQPLVGSPCQPET